MKRFIIYLICFLLAVGWFSTGVVKAQDYATIQQLEIALWPDYDRHATLAIYHIQLPADTPLPAQVQLPMPATSGNPYAAAWVAEGGELLVANYTIATQGNWNIVTLTSDSLSAQLEFYIDYEQTGSNRTLVFTWPSGFAVEDLSYEIQQPATAENLQVIPPPETSIMEVDGLTYYQASLGSIAEEQSVQIQLSYSNPSDQLSVDLLATPEPLSQSSPVAAEGGTPDIMQILPWLVGGLGICFVVVGGVLYFQSRRKSQSAKKRPRVRSRVKTSQNDVGSGADSPAFYCHQCGTKVSASDRFCRHCGVPLRR
jgi:hypothetical protein